MTTSAAQTILLADAIDRLRSSAENGDPAQVISSCSLVQKTVAELIRLDPGLDMRVLRECRAEIMKAVCTLQPVTKIERHGRDLRQKAKAAYMTMGAER